MPSRPRSARSNAHGSLVAAKHDVPPEWLGHNVRLRYWRPHGRSRRCKPVLAGQFGQPTTRGTDTQPHQLSTIHHHPQTTPPIIHTSHTHTRTPQPNQHKSTRTHHIGIFDSICTHGWTINAPYFSFKHIFNEHDVCLYLYISPCVCLCIMIFHSVSVLCTQHMSMVIYR